MRKRLLGYSLLASLRVLEPQIPASLKVLLVPVTSIDRESLFSRVPGLFLKGVQLYNTHPSNKTVMSPMKYDGARVSVVIKHKHLNNTGLYPEIFPVISTLRRL